MKSVFCVSAAFALLLSVTTASAASVEDWRGDIDTIVQDLETIHPNAFTKTDRATFLSAAEALKSALPTLSEEQRMVRAMQLVALVGDGHTQLSPNRPDFAFWYPVRLYQFTDGYFFTAAYKSDSDLVGAQVLQIAGRPVEEVIDKVRSLMGNENALDRMEHLFAFHNSVLMKGLGYAGSDGSLKIKVKLRNGSIVERTLIPHRTDDPRYKPDDSTLDWRFVSEVYGPPFGALTDWVTAYKGLPTMAYRSIDNTRPPHFTFRRPFVARAMPEQNAYYIQANSVGDWNDATFEKFFRDALSEIDKQKPANLIIDIRYNAGGDGSKVPGMIHQFIKREDNPPWKHLYLLTGRKTFSAAIMMMAAFIDHTTYTIVGEPAGSPLDSYGDPTTIDFPKAGLELDMSTLGHQLEDAGARYPIMPVDVPAPFSFVDYAAGRDPAVDAILRGDEMRSIARIALEDGGKAARRVFEARKKKYAQYADWMRIRELDLIHAFWKLNDENRHADALELAKIDVELYPDSARAWGYLGDAQIAVGDKKAGLASYEHALKLDPNSLANLDQRAALRDAKFHMPDIIRFGASVSVMEPALKNICKSVNTRRVDPPFLDNIKDKQMQIDCEGFDFEGKPRHAEFVFGDDALKLVWIMVTPEERRYLEQEMTASYGAPDHRNKTYLGYTQARAALRLDRSEVLFYAPEADGDVLPDLETVDK